MGYVSCLAMVYVLYVQAANSLRSVPKFFRWLSERYPAISQLIAENRIPEFDCLYVRAPPTIAEALPASRFRSLLTEPRSWT
jgi:hypothetical protein